MNLIWENIFKKATGENGVRRFLRENILFSDLSDREIRFLEGVVHIRHYRPDEPIFRQGEIGVGMYIICKGRVDIFVTENDSSLGNKRDIFITQLSAGDFFGELSLVEEGGRRTANALAREETQLIGFFKPDLVDILERNPRIGLKIIVRLAEVLGRRLKETTQKVSELRATLKELHEPSGHAATLLTTDPA